ncbi:MAG: hypothetical protein AB7P76_10650 [Candidatus Melainabacteria bacterium]
MFNTRIRNSVWLPALIASAVSLAAVAPAALAENTDPPHTGHITGKTVVAGLCSALIWPGIGQAINDQKGKKVATHAVLGILPPVRLVSGWDALVDRDGGWWNGKI